MSEQKTYSPGFFGRLALGVMARPRAVALGIAAVVVVALTVAGMRLRIDPNILRLLPPDNPVTQALLELDAQEGGINLLTIAVEGNDEETLDGFMTELSTRLEAMEEVEYAIYAIEDELAWNIGLRQIPVGDLQLIRDRLRAALAMGPAATNPFVAGRLLDLGPLTERLQTPDAAAAVASTNGTKRVVVRPTGSANDPAFSTQLMERVYGLLDEMAPEATGLEVVWVGGPYRHNVEDLEGIVHDLRWTAFTSLGMVFVLLTVAFRDLKVVLLLFVPLAIANAVTVGFAAITVKTLNTFTSFFLAVLIGLGVDFGIHLYSRYREERVSGGSLEECVARAWDRVGPPCAAAAVTSAGGFCALWVAGFQGFRELGTLLAGGVMICLVSVLVTLPLLIQWRERRPVKLPLLKVSKLKDRPPPTYRLAPLGLLMASLLTVALALLLPRIGFQYDLSELRREGLAYADLEAAEQAEVQDSYTPVIVPYDDPSEIPGDHQRLAEGVESGRLTTVNRVLSVHTVLPVDQADRVAVLQQIADLADRDNVKYLPPQVQSNLSRIAGSELEVMEPDALPIELRNLLGAEVGKERIMLFPAGNMWDLRQTVELRESLQEWLPDRPVAGVHLALSVLYELMPGDAPRVAGLAIVLVFFCTLIDLKSPFRSAGAVAALVTGMCWAGAALVLFDVKISITNFVGVPILMGIGVDVIIHLLHRMYEEGPGRILDALATTGWAAALSAATTVLSFASLSVATNQGIRGLGLLVVVGLTMVTAAAFAVVPLGWMTTWKVRGDLPARYQEDSGEDEELPEPMEERLGDQLSS